MNMLTKILAQTCAVAAVFIGLSVTPAPVHAGQSIDQSDDLYCLALNIFWEARSEPTAGQVAVAAVTLNRVESQYFPDTVCDVVKQGGYKVRHRCQFSWWCDGKRDDPREMDAWSDALSIAVKALYSSRFNDPTNGAVFYHADYVRPRWASRMTKLTKIGRHIFYVDNRHES